MSFKFITPQKNKSVLNYPSKFEWKKIDKYVKLGL